MKKLSFKLAALGIASLLASCGGGDIALAPEETRLQDSRVFAADAAQAAFTATLVPPHAAATAEAQSAALASLWQARDV